MSDAFLQAWDEKMRETHGVNWGLIFAEMVQALWLNIVQDGKAEALSIHSDSLDIAELYAPFSHQQLILEKSLELRPETDINPRFIDH